MKTNNLLKSLVVVAMAAITIVGFYACGKDDDPTPPPPPALPTITSFSPASGVEGDEITITGTNLTGATVKLNGTAVTTSSVTATSIKFTVPAGGTSGKISVTTSEGTVSSSTDFTVKVLGSNDVAKENIVAHWTFDDTKVEDTSGLQPETTNGTTAFMDGKIGRAIQFTSGTLIYPAMPKLNNATALADGYTVSMWVKIPNDVTNFTPLWQINGNIGDIFGLVGLAFRKNGEGFDYDGCMTHVNGTGTHSTAFDAMLEGGLFTFGTSDWAFITMTYDDATRKISYYGNGELKGQKDVAASVIPATEKFELLTTESVPGTTINKVSFGSLNTNPPFAVGPAPAGWQNTSFTGSYDDVRLFNKALTQAEITSLYNYGVAGK